MSSTTFNGIKVNPVSKIEPCFTVFFKGYECFERATKCIDKLTSLGFVNEHKINISVSKVNNCFETVEVDFEVIEVSAYVYSKFGKANEIIQELDGEICNFKKLVVCFVKDIMSKAGKTKAYKDKKGMYICENAHSQIYISDNNNDLYSECEICIYEVLPTRIYSIDANKEYVQNPMHENIIMRSICSIISPRMLIVGSYTMENATVEVSYNGKIYRKTYNNKNSTATWKDVRLNEIVNENSYAYHELEANFNYIYEQM